MRVARRLPGQAQQQALAGKVLVEEANNLRCSGLCTCTARCRANASNRHKSFSYKDGALAFKRPSMTEMELNARTRVVPLLQYPEFNKSARRPAMLQIISMFRQLT